MAKELIFIEPKTRHNWDPPIVYFYFSDLSPKDTIRLLSLIRDNLDCIVCYDANPNEPWTVNEFNEKMSKVNMFLIPVTQGFFLEPNIAYNAILPFAKENQIPILPILMENELETLFNEKCDSMECFRLSDFDDVKAFEQLQNYVTYAFMPKNVLHLLEGAFCKNIFISYRKKDNGHLKQIVDWLRSNSAFDYIKIWYDDFLVPGENYNGTIEEKIEECSLFLLLVTPSIYEPAVNGEENYVQACEVPYAIAKGKKILPVVMDWNLDEPALRQAYPTLRGFIDFADKELLIAQMQHLLDEDVVTPENLFRMGLAYLLGKDVKTDYNKGTELVEQAARQGHEQAMLQMSMICINGIGQERDIPAGIAWQRKYLQVKEARMNNGTEEREIERFLLECSDFADRLYEYNDNKMDEEVLHYYLKVCTLFEEIIPTDILTYLVAGDAYLALGKFYFYHNHTQNAQYYFNKSGHILKQLYENISEVPVSFQKRVIVHFLDNYLFLGRVYEEIGMLESAKKKYVDGLHRCTSILRNNPDPDFMICLDLFMQFLAQISKKIPSPYREEIMRLMLETLDEFPLK